MQKAITSISGFVFLIFILSCSSNENQKTTTPNWSAYSKNTFMHECMEQAKKKVDSTQAVGLCNCVMGKMMEAHPDTTGLDREKLKKESASAIVKCLF